MAFPTSGNTPLRKFTVAERFRLAYEVLDRVRDAELPLSDVTLYTPHMICGAFSVEVYLKCILSDFGASIPRKHNLRLLFDNIPKPQKQQIASLWKKQHGAAKTIETALDEVAEYFDAWRYSFERLFADLEPRDFGPLHLTLRSFIGSLHPDWLEEDPRFVLLPSLNP